MSSAFLIPPAVAPTRVAPTRHPACPISVPRTRCSPTCKLDPDASSAGASVSVPGAPDGSLIHVDKLCFSWSSARPVLHDLSFQVGRGELCMLVGPNGSGKTTLLRLLRGLLVPDEGAANVARPCAYVEQNAGRQILMPTIGHDISLSVPNGKNRPRDDVIAEIRAALDEVGLVPTDKFIKQPAERLSGGQRQRAVIAAALVRRPQVFLFDEPTASLDPQSKAEVIEAVRRLVSERNMAALWVTHLLDELEFADSVLMLDRGKLVAQGPRVAMMPLIYDLYDPE